MTNTYEAIMSLLSFQYVAGSFDPVICDHAIAQFEMEIERRLPVDYKDFVRKYGGTASGHGRWLIVDPTVGSDTRVLAGLEVFYHFGSDSRYCVTHIWELLSDRLANSVIPIASSPGGEICLSLGDNERGIYWWDREGQFDAEECERLAGDFDSFLRSVRVKDPAQ